MIRLSLTAAAVFAVMLGATVCAAPGDDTRYPARLKIWSTDISGGDLSFFTLGAHQMALLVRLCDLGRDKATTPEVQMIAVAVSKEQADALARLKELAAQKRVTLSDEPDGLGKKRLQALAKLTGPRFDKSLLEAMADARDMLETAFLAGTSSSDLAIKSVAQTDLATVKQERERARRLGI